VYVIKVRKIGYQLRLSFTKTLLLFNVSTPTKKYKRVTIYLVFVIFVIECLKIDFVQRLVYVLC
jgi:hypothetical protein